MSDERFIRGNYSAFQANLLSTGRLTKDAYCCVARWNMTLPDQHPLWSRYCITACHLRDMPDVPKATVTKPVATHEITVWSINPDYPQNLFEDGGVSFLEPVNYAQQFVCDSDEKCAWVVKELARLCVDGQLVPEMQGLIGMREMWDKAITSLLRKGAENQ